MIFTVSLSLSIYRRRSGGAGRRLKRRGDRRMRLSLLSLCSKRLSYIREKQRERERWKGPRPRDRRYVDFVFFFFSFFPLP